MGYYYEAPNRKPPKQKFPLFVAGLSVVVLAGVIMVSLSEPEPAPVQPMSVQEAIQMVEGGGANVPSVPSVVPESSGEDVVAVVPGNEEVKHEVIIEPITEKTEEPTTEQVTEPKIEPVTEHNSGNSVTLGQKNALQSAKSYISHMAFSYQDLVEQLEYEGYTYDEAIYGVENCGADWMAEALESAESYVRHSAFSYVDLIDQLEYSGFSPAEAKYGADNCGADWMAEALESAKSYIRHSAFSYVDLIDQLGYSGFTSTEAKYGADNCGADWMEEAAESAASYMKYSSFSRSELIDQLEYEGFTSAQAEYGAKSVGY